MGRHSRRRRGSSRRSRPREESGETVEPATVKKLIAVIKSEKMKEKDGNAGECYNGEPVSVIAKSEEAELNGAGQESPPEPPEPQDGDLLAVPLYDTDDNEPSPAELSSKSRLWPLEKVKWDEEPSPEESTPAEVSPESPLSSELESLVISMNAVTKENDEEGGCGCDIERVEKGVRVGWDPKLLDLMGKCLGQAQNLLFTPPRVNNMECELEIMVGSEKNNKVVWSGLNMGLTSHSMGHAQDQVSKSEFYMGREVFTVKTEKKRKLFGLGLSQKKVGLTFNPMGQAHNFIITPPIFTNSGGGFKVKISAATEVDLFSTITKMFSHAYQWHLPTSRQHFTLTLLIDDSSLSLPNLEAMNMEGVLFDKQVNCTEKRKIVIASLMLKWKNHFLHHMVTVMGREEWYNIVDRLERFSKFIYDNWIYLETGLAFTLRNHGENTTMRYFVSQDYSIQVAKLIILLVGVGRRGGVGLMHLTNTPLMEKSPLVYHWDPGGIKREGWLLCGLKRNEILQESDNTSDVQDMKILVNLIGLLWEGKIRKWIVGKWVRRFSTRDSFFIFNWSSLIEVQRKYLKVSNFEELYFNDCGDQFAQLLHVHLNLVWLNQSYKTLQYEDPYKKFGEWNRSKHVDKFLRLGFASHDIAYYYTYVAARKGDNYHNPLRYTYGVGFIWLHHSDKYQKLLKTSGIEEIFGMLKNLLRRVSPTESGPFVCLKNDKEYSTTYIVQDLASQATPHSGYKLIHILSLTSNITMGEALNLHAPFNLAFLIAECPNLFPKSLKTLHKNKLLVA